MLSPFYPSVSSIKWYTYLSLNHINEEVYRDCGSLILCDNEGSYERKVQKK